MVIYVVSDEKLFANLWQRSVGKLYLTPQEIMDIDLRSRAQLYKSRLICTGELQDKALWLRSWTSWSTPTVVRGTNFKLVQYSDLSSSTEQLSRRL